jgi:hypothetical protein
MGYYLDVKDFGAVGDGRTDDTKALQAAIDAASESGKTLLLEPGRYRTDVLYVKKNMVMKADPTWDYSTEGRCVLLPLTDTQSCVLNLNEAYGSTLEGFCVNGERRGEAMCGLLIDRGRFVREDAFRLEKLKVMRFSGHAANLDCIWCFSMRHCMLAFSGGDGLRVKGWDCFILDNWFSGNDGAGYGTEDVNASITMTGNRIEWNKKGGIVICAGNHYNISGNYIDRSGNGGIIVTGRRGDFNGETYRAFSNTIAITGNVIFRSGKAPYDEEGSCHMLLKDAIGLSVTGNTMCIGRDDGPHGVYTPDYGMILENLGSSIVCGNTMACAAFKKLIWDKGGHAPDTIIKDNTGVLAVNDPAAGAPVESPSYPHTLRISDNPWYRENLKIPYDFPV